MHAKAMTHEFEKLTNTKAKTTTKTTNYDAAKYLKTREHITKFLAGSLPDAIMDDNPALFISAVGDASRAVGMHQIAMRSGVNLNSLYRALSDDGNPSFGTILRVLKAQDYHLKLEDALETV